MPRACWRGSASPPQHLADFARSCEATVAGAHGLHARPATAFIEAAKGFDADVRVRHGAQAANGKSLAALLKLGVPANGRVTISAQRRVRRLGLAADDRSGSGGAGGARRSSPRRSRDGSAGRRSAGAALARRGDRGGAAAAGRARPPARRGSDSFRCRLSRSGAGPRLLFLERDSAPSEDEQYAAYRQAVDALRGLPLIVRTLDIGGDKEVPYLALPAEANPFLGVRGIRLCLAHPELFKTQLRAIFRAAAHGPLKIMYPMIATPADLHAALAITEEVRRELGAEKVETGIMIEVPAAVVMAPELAEHADFFSIGTNDLVQYVMAMDRGHPTLARQADGLHPAVLRLIDQTVRAATAKNRWVGVCGGLAGDPLGAVILVGLGVTELSVSIPSIAAIKARLRNVSLQDAQRLARRALACDSAEAVRALVRG